MVASVGAGGVGRDSTTPLVCSMATGCDNIRLESAWEVRIDLKKERTPQLLTRQWLSMMFHT